MTTIGMGDVITALTSAFSPANFFSMLASAVPFLAVVLPVAIGLMFLRRMVKKAGKGKVGF